MTIDLLVNGARLRKKVRTAEARYFRKTDQLAYDMP